MAKKIKFALKMQDGAEVRNIEDLREHFDIDTVVGYFLDGRLLTWLGNFYYDTEADLVEKLDKNDGQLKKKLCEIFDVEYEDDGEFDVELAAKRREKLEKLKQYTADEKILALVNNVAFDRNDMVELLDEDADTIVLVDGTYRIPLREHNKKYIGVGNVVAEIKSKEIVDFDEIGIKFENIRFDDEYAALLNVNLVEYFRQLYDESKKADDREKMREYALKGAEAGNTFLMIEFGNEYEDDKEKAFEWYMKAAQNNDTIGMLKVGRCYNFGKGVAEDSKKAVKWYKKGAALNDKQCIIELARCYKCGIGVMADIDKAITLYKSILDDGVANINLGDIYRLEDGYIDYDEAMKCYQKVIEIDENDGDAMNSIGLLLADEHESFEWFLKSAEAGYCWGMYNVADKYYWGRGVDTDVAKAITWFEKAAETGISEAMTKLGDIYRLTDGYIDYEKALQCYLKVIEMDENNGQAMNEIGELLADEHESFEWFLKSAEAGYDQGMYNVACMYYSGRGVDTDYTEAIEWFEQAAAAGVADAMIKLGDMYFMGEGVNVNEGEAAAWYKRAVKAGDTSGLAYLWLGFLSNNEQDEFRNFKKSAEAGCSVGMYELGNCYRNGKGTNLNGKKGFYWLRRAADAGYIDAIRDLGWFYHKHKQYDQAFRYFNMGVDEGDADCMLGVGLLYAYGQGVAEDKTKAVKWLRKSADNGSEEAEKMLEQLEDAKNNAASVNVSTSSSGCFFL